MSFILFKQALQEKFNEMSNDNDYLFEVHLDKDHLWNLYLDSYPEGTNEIYRERREYDCSCCRHFVKNIGAAVAIKNNKIKTIWDVNVDVEKYQIVADSLSNYVKSQAVKDVYMNNQKTLGAKRNFEKLEDGTINEYDHFHIELPDKFFVEPEYTSIPELKGNHRDTRNVFKRSLDELTEDSILTVLELIQQNSLYKGMEWKNVLNVFLQHKRAYDKLESEVEQDNYAWEQSVKVGGSIGRIRNHSIGTLLVDISEGVGLDEAVRKYEQIVAPENYKRSKPIYTKKMLEDAQKTLQELGFIDSLPRRYATLDDITVNNILFSNKDSVKKIGGGLDVFEEMMNEVAVNPRKFNRVSEMSIEKFIDDVLPTARELEVLFENKHAANLVSLIAPVNQDSKNMFKWKNNFSWAYAGNITDSSMRDRVKMAGGNVDGVLRFSIQWNDDSYNPDDFDAHCIEPNGFEIFFGAKKHFATTGELDVDIITPVRNEPAVENITWTDRDKMEEGTYKLFVHNYSDNGGKDGFKAEIEFDGQIYEFEYNKPLRDNERVQVAEVTFSHQNGFSIKEMLPSSTSTKELWNLNTNQFVPVSVVAYSPNYWDEQNGIGNKHVMFMLKDCINPEQPNGFFNEFLRQDLNKHRKVFEALASKMRVQEDDNQLSGLGFSTTQRNELVVKVKGQTERLIKIKF